MKLSRFLGSGLITALFTSPLSYAAEPLVLHVGDQNYYNIRASVEASGVLKDALSHLAETIQHTPTPKNPRKSLKVTTTLTFFLGGRGPVRGTRAGGLHVSQNRVFGALGALRQLARFLRQAVVPVAGGFFQPLLGCARKRYGRWECW